MPALRHREEDIGAIAEQWRKRRARLGGDAPTIDRTAVAALGQCIWPRNITQLLSVLDAAADGGRPITAERVRALASTPDDATGDPHIRPLAEIEMAYIRAAVERCGQNRSQAARLLGIGRSTLIRKLKQDL